MVTATAVIYALKPAQDRGKRGPGFANAAPAQEPLDVQKARAAEPSRGRDATTPERIPWLGWKDVLLRTYQEIQDDRLLALAAGVVFYSLVALFPAIAAGVSSYALVADANTIAKHLTLLANVVPGGTLDLLGTEITRIATNSDGKLTFGFAIGFLIALWSANAGMKAIFDALNIIYDEQEKRSFIWLNLISLFFTFCAIAGVLLAVSAVVVFPLILAAFGLSSFDKPIIGLLRWPVMLGTHTPWPRGPLPLRTKPARGEMALDHRGQRVCSDCLAGRVVIVLLVPREFCQLQRNLWIARRGSRTDDVDVVLHHRGVGWRGA